MTLNGHTETNGSLAGADLPPDGLDLVLQLQHHLASNPEDAQTWQALLKLQTATGVVEPLPLHLWQDIPEPPPQPWLIPEWLPVGAVTLLSGKGGVGKSRLALQLAAAIAGGAGSDANWGGPALSPNITESVPVIFASWEDPPAIISRRLSQISGAGAPWVNPTMPLYIPGEADLGLTGSGPLYGTQERWGPCELTPLAHRLFEAAEKVDAGLLVLDSAAAIYSANENDRAEVRGFLSALARRAYEGDRSVLLLAHPPKSGSDYSGSTDWLAGVRALWTLGTEPWGPPPKNKAPDERPLAWKLLCVKSNYADSLPATRRLDWQGSRLADSGLWESAETTLNERVDYD